MRNAEARALGELTEMHDSAQARLIEGEESLGNARSEASSIEQRYDIASTRNAELERQATQLTSDCQRFADRLSHLDERAHALATELTTLHEKQQRFLE